jgi:molybdopterin-guanine dinucleotide biosynthesis protein A
MGGAKPLRELAGRPLMAYAADALATACRLVAIVCKPGTALPVGPWVVWDDEPGEPRHPATGIAHAIGRARAPVLVCAADMPFVGGAECRRLVEATRDGAPAVVAAAAGGLEPDFAIYSVDAAASLVAAAARGEPLRRAVEALDPIRVELPAAALRSVDTPAELAAAERELRIGARERPLSRAPGSRRAR